jgi:hypothetical protein
MIIPYISPKYIYGMWISLQSQERVFDFSVYIWYGLFILAALGFSYKAPRYIRVLTFYTNIYVGLFLLIRFNPFSHMTFTSLDRKVAFTAGLVVLSSLTLNQYVSVFENRLKNKVFSNLTHTNLAQRD